MNLKKNIIYIILLSMILMPLNANQKDYEQYYQKPFVGIGNLKYFEIAYPDIIFEKHYIKEKDDWIITLTLPFVKDIKNPNGKKVKFYWANGSFLPEEELVNKDKYWSLLTYYAKNIREPSTYTDEEKEQIRLYGSDENRENGKGTPMFFFDAIYDTKTRGSTESHITRISFLGKHTNIHERIKEPMKRVEAKIRKAAETDKQIQDFIKSIKSYDSYAWREIRGTSRRSFHGLGLATDILPKYLAGKHIFWSWTKDQYPKTWMEIPLSKRWIPPQKIIDIFESEGFIWGGKWIIYDNMHFEYHPEIILYNAQEGLFPQTKIKK